MNETAIDTEKQIINLFPERETAVCGGWILKSYAGQLWVHPFYRVLKNNTNEGIRICEKIARYKSEKCMFRIVEYTSYYLRSRLTEENNYCFKEYTAVGELNLTDKLPERITNIRQKLCIPKISIIQRKISNSGAGIMELTVEDKGIGRGMPDITAIGRRWMDTLFLFDGNMLRDSALWNVL